MRRMKVLLTVTTAIVASALLFAAGASAVKGTFYNAETNPGWTQVSMSGAIAWNQCEGCTKWTVAVYAQPLSEPCEMYEWTKPSPNHLAIYETGGSFGTSVVFEKTGLSLLKGVEGQRLCMIGWDEFRLGPGPEEVMYQWFPVMAEIVPSVPASATAPPGATEVTPPPGEAKKLCALSKLETKRVQTRLKEAKKRGAPARVRLVTKVLATFKKHQAATCS